MQRWWSGAHRVSGRSHFWGPTTIGAAVHYSGRHRATASRGGNTFLRPTGHSGSRGRAPAHRSQTARQYDPDPGRTVQPSGGPGVRLRHRASGNGSAYRQDAPHGQRCHRASTSFRPKPASASKVRMCDCSSALQHTRSRLSRFIVSGNGTSLSRMMTTRTPRPVPACPSSGSPAQTVLA